MSALLDRLPALATTGIGSLPFDRASDAAQHSTAAYDLPFCPQLPRVDGDMIAEWLGSDPGRCGWAPDRDRERPSAWHEFVARVTARPPAHGLVKLQVTGPVTLAMALERNGEAVAGGRRVTWLARDVAIWLAANTAGQVRRLAEVGLDAILIVDEPGLALAGVSDASRGLWDPLRVLVPAWGMHICGPVPWSLVDSLELDVLSLDLAAHGFAEEGRPVLGRLLGRGGRVGWGVLDPARPTSAAASAGLAVAALSEFSGERLGPERIARQSLLTPSCGTGRLSPERELLVAATLAAAAQAVRGAVAAQPHRYRTAQQTADELRRQKHSTSANPARRSAASSSSSGK
jgi:hypothetical protein